MAVLSLECLCPVRLFLLSSVVNLCPRLPCRVDRVVRSVLRLWAGWCHLVRILALALLRETLKAPFHISKGTVLHREVTWRRQGQSPYHLLDPLGQGLHQHAGRHVNEQMCYHGGDNKGWVEGILKVATKDGAL